MQSACTERDCFFCSSSTKHTTKTTKINPADWAGEPGITVGRPCSLIAHTKCYKAGWEAKEAAHAAARQAMLAGATHVTRQMQGQLAGLAAACGTTHKRATEELVEEGIQYAGPGAVERRRVPGRVPGRSCNGRGQGGGLGRQAPGHGSEGALQEIGQLLHMCPLLPTPISAAQTDNGILLLQYAVDEPSQLY